MEASEAEAAGAGAGGGEEAGSGEDLPLAFVHAVAAALMPGVFAAHRHAVSIAFALAVMRCRGQSTEIASRPRAAAAAAAAAARGGEEEPDALPPAVWAALVEVCDGLPALRAVPSHVREHTTEWLAVLDAVDVDEFAAASLPEPFDALDPFVDFQLRCVLRRDALPALVSELLRATLGDDFSGSTQGVEYLLSAGGAGAAGTPFVVLAAPGTDALAAILRLAADVGASKRVGVIRCAVVRSRARPPPPPPGPQRFA